MKFEDVKKLNEKELTTKLNQLKGELFRMKMEKETTGLQKGHLLKLTRKDVARLLTAKSSLRKGAK